MLYALALSLIIQLAAYLPPASDTTGTGTIDAPSLCSGPGAPTESFGVGSKVLGAHALRQEQVPDPANQKTKHDTDVVQRVHS